MDRAAITQRHTHQRALCGVSRLADRLRHLARFAVAETEIEITPPSPFTPAQTPPWEQIRAQVRAAAGGSDGDGIAQFAFASVMITPSLALVDFASPSFPPGRPIGEAVLDLTLRIFREFTFDPAATTTATPLGEVLANRRGVCQDFAHLEIGCLRSLGLAARYVSGYLRTLPPPGKPRLIGADASHAWLSVWCGETLWVDFCPTNGRVVDTDFITLAWGRDYDDVSPARGVIYAAANRDPAIRCAHASEPTTARLSREHNDANALALGARMVGPALATDILDAFLTGVFEDGRHTGRIAKFTPGYSQDARA